MKMKWFMQGVTGALIALMVVLLLREQAVPLWVYCLAMFGMVWLLCED